MDDCHHTVISLTSYETVSSINKAKIKIMFYRTQFLHQRTILCDTYTISSLLVRKGTNFIVTGYKETSEDKSCHLFVYKHNGFQTRT